MNEDSTIAVRGMKPWFKSKTIWTAIGITLFGLIDTFGFTVPEIVYTSLVALAIYSLRVSKTDIL
jgi:hypothetical protein|tara:strand:+ start:218 stop:412 length:195 start_codon:yes stop_codon:yes gene_type:complete